MNFGITKTSKFQNEDSTSFDFNITPKKIIPKPFHKIISISIRLSTLHIYTSSSQAIKSTESIDCFACSSQKLRKNDDFIAK